MDFDKQLEAFQANVEAHQRGGNALSAWEVADFLCDFPNWRAGWEVLPRDQVFDHLYTARPDVPDEEPRPFLYRPERASQTHAIIRPDDSDEKPNGWLTEEGPEDIIEWLVDNPPFEEVRSIADLYQHCKMIQPSRSPWLLLMAIVGRRPLIQHPYLMVPDAVYGPTGVYGLMPVGKEDMLYLGQALAAWGEVNEAASAYTFLIDAYSSHLPPFV